MPKVLEVLQFRLIGVNLGTLGILCELEEATVFSCHRLSDAGCFYHGRADCS